MLFQVAALETYCRKHGFEPVYVHSEHSVHYEQNIFSSIKFSLNYPPNHRIGKHDSFEYIELPKVHCNSVITGNSYFQSEKYFCPKVVKELFSIKDDLRQKIVSLYPHITHSVSLHVRRGDYLNFKDIHPTCSLEYYHTAMALFPEKNFIVFSDDIEWCKHNLHGNNITYLENNLKDYEELYAMSLCSDNIIANSSFSWWGAYLNENLSKRVVYPKQWFGIKGPNDKDVAPQTWIKK